MPIVGSIEQNSVNEHHSKRRSCADGEDQISSLPHELRTNIILHLPFRDAVKTCILSRNWKNLFSSLPILAFFQHHFLLLPNGAHRFQAFIDWTLGNRDGSAIYTLSIHYDIHEQFCLTLKNTWIDFAVEHNVQNLQLVAKIDDTGLPSSLFTCKTLASFELIARRQLLQLPPSINLPNLKEMSLSNVYFPDDTLTEVLFEGCPQLVSLHVERCEMLRLRRLRISCPKLQNLRISNCSRMDRCIINVQGACLEYFYYEGYLARSFEFGTTNRVLSVSMNIWRSPDDWRNDSELGQAAWSVLKESTHARELSLSVLFIKILWEVREELWKLRYFENLTNARLYVWPTVENEETVMSLLSKFRHMQKLDMIIYRPGGFRHLLHFQMQPEKYNLEGFLEHLEYLQIECFEGLELEMGLLKYFLRNGESLTRVTLRTRQHDFYNDGLKQESIDELAQLSESYPTVTITGFDVDHTID